MAHRKREVAWEATRAASGAADWSALASTITELQASAHELVDRMLTVTEDRASP